LKLHLTRKERSQVFAGTLNVLRRPKRPDLEPGETFVVSSTRARKQIVDRDNGATVDIPRQPNLWITVKGWKLKDGEWEAPVSIHDVREPTRRLAAPPGGHSRQAGLRTRSGQTVDAEGQTRPRRIPAKGEEVEHFTAESERGYGGSATTAIDEAAAVDDATLDEFTRRVQQENEIRRARKSDMAEKMREERQAREEFRSGRISGARAARRRAQRAERRATAAA
jgi:hypothetical protein